MHTTRRYLLSTIALIVIAGTAFGQTKRAMTIVDLLEVPRLQDPQLSPDGSQIAFVLSIADWEKNKAVGHIWRVNADGSDRIQITNGDDGERSPRWSPDGAWIAFIAKRGDDEFDQIYIMRNRGGEASRLTDHGASVSGVVWSPDSESIFFIAPDPKTEEEKKKDELKDDVIVFDEDFKQRHLWRVRAADGVEERITEGDYSVRSFSLSRIGAVVAYHRTPTPLYDDSDEGEVWIMKADGSDARRLTSNTVSEYEAEVSPDGRSVLFLSDSNADFVTYYNTNLFVTSVDGGAPRMLLPDLPYDISEAEWSADGGAIFFAANTGVRNELFKIDVASETLTQLTRGDHAVGNWDYSPGAGKHVFTIRHRTNAGDVHILDGEAGPVKVTDVFDFLDQQYILPRQEAIRWKGEDGVEVEGLLFYPLDYESGKRYALAVQTHGGPASSDRFGFGSAGNFVQVLTAKGYFVLKPNYRGSTGYGDAFLRDMVGSYFRQSHLDVMAGVDHLISEGLVDGDRMVKMGWSAGGHMTNKIITHTDRFKAASSGAGAVNWISMYGQSDVRIYRTPWFGGTPWEEDAPIETYWENSPLSDIHRVTTPTIVLVGENDVRVPPPQSVELYRALKSNGVPTHLYIAPREPHGWRELRHQLFKTNVQLDWFEKYCMEREYEWETAPGAEEEGEEEVQD